MGATVSSVMHPISACDVRSFSPDWPASKDYSTQCSLNYSSDQAWRSVRGIALAHAPLRLLPPPNPVTCTHPQACTRPLPLRRP
jgi:hypothetical protein